MLDKGLDISAGFGKRVAFPVEIERHRMTVEGFGNITSLIVPKMIPEQLNGVLRWQRTETKQRPIKRCWHRETTGEHHPMTSVAKRTKKMNHGVLMTFTEPVNVVDDQHPTGSVDVFNHGVKVTGKRAGAFHPLTRNGLPVTEFVHRCPANDITLVAAPRSQKGRLPDTGKPADKRMAVLLNQVRELLKFLCSSNEGMLHTFLNRKRRLFFNDGFGMVVKPCSPFFGDVVHLTATSTASDDVRHPDGDVFLVQQDVQRLIES